MSGTESGDPPMSASSSEAEEETEHAEVDATEEQIRVAISAQARI